MKQKSLSPYNSTKIQAGLQIGVETFERIYAAISLLNDSMLMSACSCEVPKVSVHTLSLREFLYTGETTCSLVYHPVNRHLRMCRKFVYEYLHSISLCTNI